MILKKYIFIGIIFQFCLCVSASEVDSLKRLTQSKDLDKRFNALCILADIASDSDLKLSLNYAKKALVAAKILNKSKYKGMAYNAIANVYQYNNSLDSALFFHQKALIERQIAKDPIAIADTWNNLGIIYDTKGQYPQALEYYFKALAIFEDKNSIAKSAMTNSNIGIVFKAQKNYDKALKYYRTANKLYLKTNDEIGKVISASNLASLLINFGSYAESIKYSEIAKKGYKRLNLNRYIPYAISNIAIANDSLRNDSNAEVNYKEAIELNVFYENWFEAAEIANAYAIFLNKKRRFRESEVVSKTALLHSTKSDADALLQVTYKNLSYSSSNLNDPAQALILLQKSISIGDKIFENEKTKAIFEADIKYETSKKEKIILVKTIEAARAKNRVIIISSILIAIAFLAIFVFNVLRNKINRQKKEHELKEVKLELDSKIKLQTQRLGISRDLHDNIGSQLTFITSSVDNLKFLLTKPDQKLENKLERISVFTKDAINDLRDTVWAMNLEEVSDIELQNRLNSLLQKAQEANNDVDFNLVNKNNTPFILSALQGMNIYRVIQEAMNNSIKYANANEISVNFEVISNQLFIQIKDNGKGFEVDKITQSNGLKNMEYRMSEINGDFMLFSNSSGTQIDLSVLF